MRRAAPLKKNQTGGPRPSRGRGRGRGNGGAPVNVVKEEPKVEVEPIVIQDSVSVASVPVDSVPVDSVSVASVPVDSVPVDSVPVASVPVDSVPVESIITTLPSRMVFVSHCDLSDVMTPMPYILDFIQKYRQRYGENTTSFFLSADSRHKTSIQELYHEYAEYMPLLPFDDKINQINPCFTEDEQECRIYCWRRHFPSNSNSSPPPPCNSLSPDFIEFFQQIFNLFNIGMSRNLGRYLPSLQSTLPGQEKMKRVRNLLHRANPQKLPIVFYLNSDDDDALTSTSTSLSKGTSNMFFQKFTHVFWVVSHHHSSIQNSGRDNLVFLADLLQLSQDQPFTVADYQAVSANSRLTLTGMLSGIALLTRLQETTAKPLLVVPSDEKNTNTDGFLQEANPAMGEIHLLSSAEEMEKYF